MQELALVPLSTALFPDSLAKAFALPSLSEGNPTANKTVPVVANVIAYPSRAKPIPVPPAFQPAANQWSSMMPQQRLQQAQQGPQPTTSGSLSIGGAAVKPVMPSYGGLYMAYPPPYASSLPGTSVSRGSVTSAVACLSMNATN